MSCIIEVSYQDLVDNIYCVPSNGNNILYYNDNLVLGYIDTGDSVAHAEYQYLYAYYPSASYYVIYSYGFQNAAEAIPRNAVNNAKTFFITLESGCSSVSFPYSTDCPFTYELYIKSFVSVLDGSVGYWYMLKIKKSTVVVYDQRIYNKVDYNSNYAESVMQTFIDDCIANLKIKTTCCILVCCEPDKYELIT